MKYRFPVAILARPVSALALDTATSFQLLEAPQAAANATAGPRSLPSKLIPVPQADLSPQAQGLAANPYRAPA